MEGTTMVSVRTLSGATFQYSLQPGDTLSTFCKRVQQQGGLDLSACKVFCSGRVLSSKQVLETLGLGPNSFLVAVPDASRKQKQRRTAHPDPTQGAAGRAPEAAEGPRAGSAAADVAAGGFHAPRAAVQGAQLPDHPSSPTAGALDTLLPGYHLRPSPSKPRRRAPLPPPPPALNLVVDHAHGERERQQQVFPAQPSLSQHSGQEATCTRGLAPPLSVQAAQQQDQQQQQQQQQQVAQCACDQLALENPAIPGGTRTVMLEAVEHAACARPSQGNHPTAARQTCAAQAFQDWRQLLDAMRARLGDSGVKASAARRTQMRQTAGKQLAPGRRGGRHKQAVQEVQAVGEEQHEQEAAGVRVEQVEGDQHPTEPQRGRKRKPAATATKGNVEGSSAGVSGGGTKRRRQGPQRTPAAPEAAECTPGSSMGGVEVGPGDERQAQGGTKGKGKGRGRGQKDQAARGGDAGGSEGMGQRAGEGGGKKRDAGGKAPAEAADERVCVCLDWLKAQDRALDKLPLPETLQRLQRWLVVLVEFHTMMHRHHAHLTWDVLARGLTGDGQHAGARNTLGSGAGQAEAGMRMEEKLGNGLQDSGCHSPLQPSDVLNMACVAASLVSVRNPMQPHQDPGRPLADRPTGQGLAAGSAAMTAPDLDGGAMDTHFDGGGGGGDGGVMVAGSGCIEADVMAYGWSQTVAQQVARPTLGAHSEGLGTLQVAPGDSHRGKEGAEAGTGQAQAGCMASDEGWDTVIELTDPGRLEVDITLLESCTTAPGQAPQVPQLALQQLPVMLLRRRGAQGVGRVARFTSAFRRCLVAAVLQLHNEFMLRRSQTGELEAQRGGSVTCQNGSGVTSTVGECGAGGSQGQRSAPTSGQQVEEDQGGSDMCEAWDPLCRGTWHPLFPLHSISATEAAQAARTIMAAAAIVPAGDGDGERGGAVDFGEGAEEKEKVRNVAARPPRAVRPRRSNACPTRCTSTQALAPLELLEHLKGLGWYEGQLHHKRDVPARPARFATPTVPLGPAVQRVLDARGTHRLFLHQAQAIDSIMKGQPTVIATSTASGKSLCFQVPIVAALESDPAATALLMFPTKALAQDQKASLCGMLSTAFGPEAAQWADTYDGDTARFARDEVRTRCRLLITNPDMLHCSILPAHTMFVPLLSGLRYVVLDEGHSYYGAFGAHTAMVVRRLRRLCRQYGSNPTFVVASATIANPGQHTQLLLGMDQVTVVDDDGSPHGPKSFVLWNPPLTFVPASRKVEQKWVLGPVKLTGSRGPAPQGVTSRDERPDQGAAGQGKGAGRGQGREGYRAAKLAKRQRVLQLWSEMEAKTRGHLEEQQDGRQEGQGQVDPDQQDPAQAEHVDGSMGNRPRQGKKGKQQGGKHKVGMPGQASAEVGEDGSLCGDSGCLAAEVAEARAAISAAVEMLPGTCYAPTNAAGVGRIVEIEQDGEEDGVPRMGGSQPDADNGLWLLTASGYVKVPPGGSVSQRGGAARVGSRAAGSRAAGSRGAGAARDMPPLGEERGALGGKRPAAAHAAERLQQLRLMAMRRFPGRTNWRRMVAEQKQKVQALSQGQTPEQEQRRASPIVEMSLLLAECIQHGLRTIAFCKSRKLSELVATYTFESLKANAPQLVNRLKVYRGGYSPAERRAIEAELFNGQLLGVAATNALELGVDVGSLDVTLHLGFPGSVSSLRQQAGRAGRREQQSLAVFVAFDGPLDQHFMRNPDHLLARPVESVQLDPNNSAVLAQHVLCAAAELPLTLYAPGQEPTALQHTPDPYLIASSFAPHPERQACTDTDLRLFGPGLETVASQLKARGLLGPHPHSSSRGFGLGASSSSGYGAVEVLHYTGTEERVSRGITLRSIDPEHFVIVDETRNLVLEQVEARMAFFQVYDGAVYMHQGRTYLCSHLDLSSRVAKVRPADVKYYTRVRDMADIHVTGGRVAYPIPLSLPTCQHCKPEDQGTGPVASQPPSCTCCRPCTSATVESAVVTIRWLGYTRVWQGTGQVMDVVDLHLPDFMFETQATYLRVPRSARVEAETLGLDFRAGLHAAGHALLNVLPLFLVCNPKDVGTECDHPLATRFRIERLLLYDKQHAGGVGLAAQAAPLLHLLMEHAHKLVVDCPCDEPKGCPSCIHHSDCPNYNVLLCKRGAEIVLRHTLEAEAQAMGLNKDIPSTALHDTVQDEQDEPAADHVVEIKEEVIS